jgi:hypothetical protein
VKNFPKLDLGELICMLGNTGIIYPLLLFAVVALVNKNADCEFIPIFCVYKLLLFL